MYDTKVSSDLFFRFLIMDSRARDRSLFDPGPQPDGKATDNTKYRDSMHSKGVDASAQASPGGRVDDGRSKHRGCALNLSHDVCPKTHYD